MTLVGENLSGSLSERSADTVVQFWLNQRNYYNYDDNTCSQLCGHYTQVKTGYENTKKNICAKISYQFSVLGHKRFAALRIKKETSYNN